MQKQLPKPYLMLEGQTVLERTLRQFLLLQDLVQVLVPTSEGYVEKTQEMLDTLLPETVSGKAIVGGDERQLSIQKALHKVSSVELILVHDAVRPFVTLEYINACCRAALRNGAATLGIPAQDTIKEVDDRQFVEQTPVRSRMWQTQTPQVFRPTVLKDAYKQAGRDNFTGTDDASLVEYMGQAVKMVAGDRMNIKLTYPVDLELAKIIINQTEA